MPLKIRLKAHEKILLGNVVITNGERPAEFFVENKVSVLREKDIMKEDAATTPGRRLYFLAQLMYMDSGNQASYHATYWELAREIITAAPSTKPFLEEISTLLLEQDFYHALKVARRLVDYEDQLTEPLRVSSAD
ncbi:flagellar biosynthesis repressor FlbT [Geobacter argillaceus]|uniref:Flagellar protein FlbT n=1 Tax=Geobacter argillaceus TaxID=345631 RepID=A0A562VMA6_9BACT|nr:flagellar biosynthesis repressor FlbT [Geobacter argillaceus]TWJ18867.1 flagellar protein FlbT [Geobacter argillaceus]